MIIHTNPQNNFTKISNAFIQDSNISAEAKIVGILLMSYPSDWVVHIPHLSKALGKGIATIRKAIKELVEIGKLSVSEQPRDTQGRFLKDEKVYEFIGEVESEILAEITQEEFLNIQQSKTEQSTENKEFLPQINLPQADKVTTTKNNINNKEKIYIAQDSKKHILISNLFKIPKQSLNLDFSFLSDKEKEAYEKFITYRQETRRFTISTKKKILEKLQKLKEQGENIIAVIERSIESGWVGLFEIPQFKGQKQALKSKTQTTQIKGSSEEIALHTELLNALLAENPSFSLERFKENKIEVATHSKLGLIGIHKEAGILRLCDKTQEEKYLQELKSNVAQQV